MNLLNNKSNKDAIIQLNQAIYLIEKHNISIDKSKLHKELEEGTLIISLNSIDKTLHVYSTQDSDLSITISNITVSDFKAVRAKGLIRYMISNIRCN